MMAADTVLLLWLLVFWMGGDVEIYLNASVTQCEINLRAVIHVHDLSCPNHFVV